MKLEDFVSKGLLREVNRNFFHPRGLCLRLHMDEETGEINKVSIKETDDPEGFYFEPIGKKKAEYSNELLAKHAACRIKMFGSIVQPLDDSDEIQENMTIFY